jgi:hypothetical protein
MPESNLPISRSLLLCVSVTLWLVFASLRLCVRKIFGIIFSLYLFCMIPYETIAIRKV